MFFPLSCPWRYQNSPAAHLLHTYMIDLFWAQSLFIDSKMEIIGGRKRGMGSWPDKGRIQTCASYSSLAFRAIYLPG